MLTADTITDEQIREHTAHVRITKTAAGRTWCGSPGRRVVTDTRTLCGADVTAYDMSERDVRKMLRDPRWCARVCSRCAEILNARGAK